MKFVTDGMLGRLTRWLRLVGNDVICINDYSFDFEEEDEALLKMADKESRCLLTRDVDLYRRALRRKLKAVLIEGEGDIPRQFSDISRSLDESLDIDIDSSRCPVCNGELKRIQKPSVSGEVPEGVLKSNEVFWRCNDCNKIYWPGTHWKKIIETIKKCKNLGEINLVEFE